MNDLRWFNREDFKCKCGCNQNLMREETMQRVDRARDFAGIPFIPTSGYRCPSYNASVGSKSDVHPNGHAVDIAATNSRQRFLVIRGAMMAGFTRIGVAKTFIHMDDDPQMDPNVTWVY